MITGNNPPELAYEAHISMLDCRIDTKNARIRKLEKALVEIAKGKVDIPSEYATRYEAAAYHDLVLYLKTIAREALGAE